MSTVANTLPSNPLGGFGKYFDLAASAAIAVQQVAKDAPGQTKLNLALSFVNVGLGVAAQAAPGIAPILGLAVGLESPFASLISGIVGLFKHHQVNGFTSSSSKTPSAAAAAVPQAVQMIQQTADWNSGAQVGG
jgi:hypothetical protein